ncbi:MAG: hypothetical protein UV61_C0014G0014 [Candidatus Gottesmanbacteria bacterium GW2011_GWB1_43_11]|uniref:Uncharacterized protein n=1 Tax=Candidatus Gottesmanbacteria bacterium GW2011_GWB1_43_11 TaxID=1618446 RepID=A0A0G1CK89_9BACT|nr:MAG: hypothetical protein UV04_C0041G0010 [Candidatus Gottesmanbacteria bacterium GW2011_GWA2_42_16]KKS53128.1 MAG: hypothetical protein UV17_C0040G0008 [Candidatus Gottesmanbacteria bacterium GW2011_GWA1_42_26]KKS81687.1 MAG: hypothetical protein UV55_C0010G0016 [Candidatus Gottesmanbacteria bacterium GW2011_GWC1_43_10]KKS85914.1 MAG: hypothetical protein UV61_C0014G0014 [Candidatus Gottesmanbacteria bacterium GW2011_GWB1_43_11]
MNFNDSLQQVSGPRKEAYEAGIAAQNAEYQRQMVLAGAREQERKEAWEKFLGLCEKDNRVQTLEGLCSEGASPDLFDAFRRIWASWRVCQKDDHHLWQDMPFEPRVDRLSINDSGFPILRDVKKPLKVNLFPLIDKLVRDGVGLSFRAQWRFRYNEPVQKFTLTPIEEAYRQQLNGAGLPHSIERSFDLRASFNGPRLALTLFPKAGRFSSQRRSFPSERDLSRYIIGALVDERGRSGASPVLGMTTIGNRVFG